MAQEVLIASTQITAQELKSSLEYILSTEEDIAFQLRAVSRRVRGIDPTVLIAIVGAASTILGTLIGGVLKIAKEKGSQKIIIVGRSGARIEVPADTQPEIITKYAEIAKDLDIEQIHL